MTLTSQLKERLAHADDIEAERLHALLIECVKALDATGKWWFNMHDPNDKFCNCACLGCDMGDSGRKTDERGHDLDCHVGIAGRALTKLRAEFFQGR